MPATASSPAINSQGEPSFAESSADKVPNTATSAKVRSPALADGLRSRSSPISRPMARLVRNCGNAPMPLPCNKAVSIVSSLKHFIRRVGCAHHVGRSPTYKILFISIPPMPDDELQTLRAIVFIDAQAVHGMDLSGQRLVG